MGTITSRLDKCSDRHKIAHPMCRSYQPELKISIIFLLDLSPISDAARGGPELNSNG